MNVKLSSIKTKKKGAGIKEAGCLNLYKPSVCVRKGVRTSETYALLKCRPVDMWWVGSRAESESLSPSCPPGLKTNPMIGTSSTCRLGKEKIIIIIKKNVKHTLSTCIICVPVVYKYVYCNWWLIMYIKIRPSLWLMLFL